MIVGHPQFLYLDIFVCEATLARDLLQLFIFLTLLLLSSISFSSPTAFAAKLSAAEEKFVDDGLSLALVVEKRNQG